MNRLRGMMLGLVDQTAGDHSHVAGGFEGFDGELVDSVDGAAAIGDWLGHRI
jgi:hypothetical protein